ncbi:hypothetical protein HOD83_00270 [Candidatus Woesearchaeota archaeon]|jgi:hypothetical protein|nr:hypothetical protein [Candidatus Woesearchaeota archaeon]MBT4248012.1 hypothetical protein [Candidatus Woesearchaeota archaeon]
MILFISGIFVGIRLDIAKSDDIHDRYRQTELDWYDIQLQTEYYQVYPVENECDVSIQNNLAFADKVYLRGQEIERYEAQQKVFLELQQDKVEYGLLKFQFWLNAVRIRDVCDANYVTVMYFYKDVPTGVEEIQQNAMSSILFDLKQELGSDMVLVPLAIDLNVDSIDLLTSELGITTVPSISINEELVLNGVISERQVKTHIKDYQTAV